MSNKPTTMFESELIELSQQSRPLVWSSAQNHLANKLVFLHQYPTNAEKVEELKNSLDECSQEESPQDWAANYYKLGDALHAKSQQEKAVGVKLLNESLEAYKNVLMVWSRQDAPSDWSATFNNLGMLFKALGERTQGMRTLEKSVAAFNNALTLRTRENSPLEWAICQNNMGVSLRILAELRQDIPALKDSVECYGKALQVIIQEHTPVGWVTATANLGDAQIMLAVQLNDIELAHKAIAGFDSVVEYFQNAGLAEHLALAKEHQTGAQAILQNITT